MWETTAKISQIIEATYCRLNHMKQQIYVVRLYMIIGPILLIVVMIFTTAANRLLSSLTDRSLRLCSEVFFFLYMQVSQECSATDREVDCKHCDLFWWRTTQWKLIDMERYWGLELPHQQTHSCDVDRLNSRLHHSVPKCWLMCTNRTKCQS